MRCGLELVEVKPPSHPLWSRFTRQVGDVSTRELTIYGLPHTLKLRHGKCAWEARCAMHGFRMLRSLIFCFTANTASHARNYPVLPSESFCLRTPRQKVRPTHPSASKLNTCPFSRTESTNIFNHLLPDERSDTRMMTYTLVEPEVGHV